MKEKLINISIIAIFIIAIIFRVYYDVCVPLDRNQNDVGSYKFNSEEDYDNLYKLYNVGTLEATQHHYILEIYHTGNLPNSANGQLYHPPLHFFILANWLKLADNFMELSSSKIESMQFVTGLYSILSMLVFYLCLKECGVEKKNRVFPLFLASVTPIFVIVAGLISNDSLVILFEMISLLYILKWEKNPSIKNATMLALAIGFGLMTKSSILVMLVPSIYVYFKKFKQKETLEDSKLVRNLIIELIIFIVIMCVLGGWFHIVKAKKGLNTIGIVNPLESLSVRDKSLWNRFGLFNPFVPKEENIWSSFIITSVFCSYRADLFGKVLLLYIAEIIMILICCISLYFVIKLNKKQDLLLITFITWSLSFIYLNIRFPYTCSSNARYLVVPFFIMLMYLGIGIETVNDKFYKNMIKFGEILLILMSFKWIMMF